MRWTPRYPIAHGGPASAFVASRGDSLSDILAFLGPRTGTPLYVELPCDTLESARAMQQLNPNTCFFKNLSALDPLPSLQEAETRLDLAFLDLGINGKLSDAHLSFRMLETSRSDIKLGLRVIDVGGTSMLELLNQFLPYRNFSALRIPANLFAPEVLIEASKVSQDIRVAIVVEQALEWIEPVTCKPRGNPKGAFSFRDFPQLNHEQVFPILQERLQNVHELEGEALHKLEIHPNHAHMFGWAVDMLHNMDERLNYVKLNRLIQNVFHPMVFPTVQKIAEKCGDHGAAWAHKYRTELTGLLDAMLQASQVSCGNLSNLMKGELDKVLPELTSLESLEAKSCALLLSAGADLILLNGPVEMQDEHVMRIASSIDKASAHAALSHIAEQNFWFKYDKKPEGHVVSAASSTAVQ